MLNDQRAGTSREQEDDDHGDDEIIRDIHALTPPQPPQASNRGRPREAWETGSQRSSTLSMASIEGASSENFTSMSREFSALVVAGSTIGNSTSSNNDMNDSTVNNPGNNNTGLGRIGEEDNMPEVDTNPLALVLDNYHSSDPIASPRRIGANNNTNTVGSSSSSMIGTNQGEISVHMIKKEEVESKISAWQNAKIAKLNNRFKREDAIINGWESEQVQKASSWMKKIERKLEEKKARALEKMQNDIAKAHRKAEERKASAEAKRGTKVARILEIANLMRAVGRAPAKKSFF